MDIELNQFIKNHTYCSPSFDRQCLKGVFAKNEMGYRLNAIKKAFLIATNLTSICCVYKEKIDKDVSYRRA